MTAPRSWVDGAAGSGHDADHLPYGVFEVPGEGARVGVRIGDQVLDLTPVAVADALSVAGTPEEWIERLRSDVLPTGMEHLLVSFADPFTVRAWSGREIAGVPDLAGQLRLFMEEVAPALA